jgi:hypothetical protein
MMLWNVNVLHVLAEGGAAGPIYAIQANNVVFHLPAGTGVHVRYHSPFSDGTTEQALHHRPLEERLTLLHQLRNVFLTVGEEQQILADMEPVIRSSALPVTCIMVSLFLILFSSALLFSSAIHSATAYQCPDFDSVEPLCPRDLLSTIRPKSYSAINGAYLPNPDGLVHVI